MKRVVNGEPVELELGQATARTSGDRLLVTTSDGKTHSALAVKDGDVTLVSYRGRQYRIGMQKASRSGVGKDHSGDLISPMPGAVVDVLVSQGQTVSKGEKLIILEAMKTQQSFLAPFDGLIDSISVTKGDQVTEGFLMAVVKPAED